MVSAIPAGGGILRSAQIFRAKPEVDLAAAWNGRRALRVEAPEAVVAALPQHSGAART